MTLKQLRMDKGLSQIDCAKFLQVPYRTYCRYENEKGRENTVKYRYMLQKLSEY